jgi:hypothetical protein
MMYTSASHCKEAEVIYKFKEGDKVWWKVDGTLHEGIVRKCEEGFYAIKSTLVEPGTIVMCSLSDEHKLHTSMTISGRKGQS